MLDHYEQNLSYVIMVNVCNQWCMFLESILDVKHGEG